MYIIKLSWSQRSVSIKTISINKSASWRGRQYIWKNSWNSNKNSSRP